MEFFPLVLSVLPIQTIEYLCSQEYSRLEGLSGDHLVQAFSGSRNFDQIAWDLFSFEFSQKLGGPCVLPLLTRVFPWETFFFQISSFSFSYWSLCILQLQGVQGVFFSSLYPMAAYLKRSVLSSLGNKTLPPDLLAIASIHPAQHILDVLLQVCARHRALAGFYFPGLAVSVCTAVVLRAESGAVCLSRITSMSLDRFGLGLLPARYSPSCSITFLSPQDGGESKMGKLG